MAKITPEKLRKMSKEEIKLFIRMSLTDEGNYIEDHKRFDMSGYDCNYTSELKDRRGENTINNMEIINTFAYLGIYDYTEYVFVDFYKGISKIHLKYFYNEDDDECNLEIELTGEGTIQIIYTLFELTILSERKQRRRLNRE
jgi:hypothetical protein